MILQNWSERRYCVLPIHWTWYIESIVENIEPMESETFFNNPVTIPEFSSSTKK